MLFQFLQIDKSYQNNTPDKKRFEKRKERLLLKTFSI